VADRLRLFEHVRRRYETEEAEKMIADFEAVAQERREEATENPQPQTEDPRPQTISGLFYEVSKQARELAARGEIEAARVSLTTALAAWRGLNPYYERIRQLPLLALAASEVDPGCARLRVELEPLIKRAIQWPRQSSDRRRDVAWALTDLGDWTRAFELAYDITSPSDRHAALKWLVVRAPLLARLGLEDERARALAEGHLTLLEEQTVAGP
jgi:hypothetical protein